MAEFEKGHCTGCGYLSRKWGHRPYCWRVVTCLVDADTNLKNVRRCLIEMNKHHRILSLFLSKKEHTYYTVESIDRALSEHKQEE